MAKTLYDVYLTDANDPSNTVSLGCHNEDGVFMVPENLQVNVSAFFARCQSPEDADLNIEEISYEPAE
jgi:hypothetical protein